MTRRPRPRINVTIDRLLLRGFPAEQRDAIAAGIAAELQQQWQDPAVVDRFGSSRSLDTVRAHPIRLAAEARPQQVGAQVGRAIARSTRP
jgi:hypothetical protein